VLDARANLATNQAAVEFESGRTNVPAALKAVKRSGYSAELSEPMEASGHEGHGEHELAGWGRLLLVAIVLLTPLVVLHFWTGAGTIGRWVQLGCATGLQFYVGWPFLVGALDS
jgi:cation transport ATPase